MKEGYYNRDKSCIFRETFNSEFNVRKNNGVPTDVTFSDGVGSFNGSSSFINEDILLNTLKTTTVGSWRLIFKPSVTVPSSSEWILSFSKSTSTNYIALIFSSSNGRLSVGASPGGVFNWSIATDDGVWTDLTYKEIVVTFDGSNAIIYINGVAVPQSYLVTTDKTWWFADDPTLNTGRIGNYKVTSAESGFFNGDIELIEIYNRDLTIEEVKNLYERKTYRDIRKGLVLDVDSRLGTIKDNLGNTITSTDVEVKRDIQRVFDFNGSTSFLNIDSILSQLATTTTGTLSAWVNIPELPSGSEAIFGFGDEDNADFLGLLLYIRTTGKINASLYDNGSTYYFDIETDNQVVFINKWTHVSLVQDGITPLIYIDGIAVSQTISGTNQGYWFNNLSLIDTARIGSQNSDNAGEQFFLNSKVSQARIYNKALTAQEIMQLYTFQKNQYE